MPDNMQHPAWAEEAAHLQDTLALVSVQLQEGEQELHKAQSELKSAFRYDRDNRDVLELRNLLYERADRLVKNLTAALNKPYFTHIDFTEEGQAQSQTYYIGKHTIMHEKSLEPAVFDWRAPIANLYYSGQVGPMHYIAPDGEIKGDLTLKRQLGIENGVLQSIFDTDVVSQDAYLQQVLGAATGDRLKDIVTSIQAEQNDVIRCPINRTLLVQGVAGSGKTTIALHRIAYLLYAYQDSLRPEHVAILAPNPMFLGFIAGVLPDLGVEKVRQTTYVQFVAEWLGDALPPVNDRDMTDDVLSMPPHEQDAFSAVMRWKGSLSAVKALNNWLDEQEQNLPIGGPIRFGPVTLFTGEEIQKRLLVDEKPFPWHRRIAEFKKELTGKAKKASEQVIAFLRSETSRREEIMLRTLPAGELRRLRLVKLYDSRDARIKETQDSVKPFIADVMKRFPKLTPVDMYRDFWTDVLSQADDDSPQAMAAAYTLERAGKKSIDREDVALIAMIALRVCEQKRLDVRHLVIDEAQDFSPAEYDLLHRMTRGASMTVVGDLMQGIRGYRGLNDWRELDPVFAGKADLRTLETSYRSTVEIMTLAAKVASHYTRETIKPVLRHGRSPVVAAYESDEEQASIIAQTVRAWQAEGLNAICVIHKSLAQLSAIMNNLPGDMQPTLLDVNAAEYTGGLLLARAADVKGFEFDGVIVADVSDSAFADRPLDGRLLYVCLTRPLHRLCCLYHGTPTPLLA